MRYLYKRSRMARKQRRVRYAAQAGLIAAAVVAWSGAAAGTLDLNVRNGLVTMDAHAAPLGEVLRTLSEKAGFALVMKNNLSAPVTWRFEAVPVEQAVSRLLRNVSSVALYAPAAGQAAQALAEVRILRGGNNNAPLVEHRTQLADGRDIHAPPSDLADNGGAERMPRIATRTQLASTDSDLSPASRGPAEIDPALEDGDPAGRRTAALRDAKRRPDQARGALNAALGDPDFVVRQRAVQGLARAGGEESVASLSHVLLQDPDPRVRRMAAGGLSRLNTESAFWALMEANSDEDQGVRDAVVAALDALERRGVAARAETAGAPKQ